MSYVAVNFVGRRRVGGSVKTDAFGVFSISISLIFYSE